MLELLASENRPFAQDALAYFVCIAALVWGAGPERAVALIWLIFFEFLMNLYLIVWGPAFQLQRIDVFLASGDIVAGFIWVIIAVNANRNYPLLIAALQLLTIGAHLARGLIESIAPVAYAVMVVAPGWLQLLVLGAGVGRHVLRRRRYGPYREWRVPVQWFGLLPARHEKR